MKLAIEFCSMQLSLVNLFKVITLFSTILTNLIILGPWHVGKSPDHRALDTMEKHNLAYTNKARKIKNEDFNKFDYIFGMDFDNMEDLNGMKPDGANAKVLLLGEFDPQGEKIIRDPYYDRGSAGFEKAYEQSVRCCEAFLKKVLTGEI